MENGRRADGAAAAVQETGQHRQQLKQFIKTENLCKLPNFMTILQFRFTQLQIAIVNAFTARLGGKRNAPQSWTDENWRPVSGDHTSIIP